MSKDIKKRLKVEDSVFIMVDIQERLLPAMYNKFEVEKNNISLIKVFNEINLKVLVSEQYPKGLGHTIPSIERELNGAEILEKTSFSVYDDCKKNIDELVSSGKKTFILSGIESHICVYQTVKDLISIGCEVYLVSDATGSRNSKNHERSLDTLSKMGAVVLPTESILFELIGGAKHPAFKLVSQLIK